MAEQEYTVAKAMRELDEISKGLFKPAVGAMKEPIKGSWKTRHFPKRTPGGRRQLREQAEAKAAASAPSAADRMFDASYAASQRSAARSANYGLYGANAQRMNRLQGLG